MMSEIPSFLELPHLLAEEEIFGRYLQDNFQTLKSIASNIDYHIELYFEFSKIECKRDKDWVKYHKWSFIGLESTILELNGFKETLNALSSHIENCPSIEFLIKKDCLNSAFNIFDLRFPMLKQVRTGVAHPHEFNMDSKNFKKHSITVSEFNGMETLEDDTDGRVFMSGCILGDEYVSTVKGKKLSMKIGNDIGSTLKKVIEHICSAFVNVAYIAHLERYKEFYRQNDLPEGSQFIGYNARGPQSF